MDTIKPGDNWEVANANKVGDILYIDEVRKKFLPQFVYYLLVSKDCKGVCFRGASRIYKLEDLIGKEDWHETKKSRTKRS